ncbi:MAG: hypothetical protein KF875_03760 [Trueperaceae bacterium]|nr:hypothetical protein [Trueperaceae bacterium]
MGLASDEFWTLTPRRFALIARERVSKQDADREAADRRAALIAAVIANQGRGKGKRRVAVEDFLPRRSPSRSAASKAQSIEEMKAVMRLWEAATVSG